MGVRIHPTAEVSPEAVIGDGSSIWRDVQVREGVVMGRQCIVGKGAYIDFGVQIGDNVKIQNNASLYNGLTLEDGVFVGPHVVFTNDRVPRGINPDGTLKSADDWHVSPTHVGYGSAIGAGSIIRAGIRIGRWALVGAGSVVTRDVPDHALVMGNPARIHGYISASGVRCSTQEEAITRTQHETAA